MGCSAALAEEAGESQPFLQSQEMGLACSKDRNGAGAQQLGAWRLGNARMHPSFTETTLVFLLRMGASAFCCGTNFFVSQQLSFPFLGHRVWGSWIPGVGKNTAVHSEGSLGRCCPFLGLNFLMRGGKKYVAMKWLIFRASPPPSPPSPPHHP